MTQPPDETPDFLAKPVSPSGEQPGEQPSDRTSDQPPPPPTYPTYGGGEPTSPYVSQPGHGGVPPQPGYQPYAQPYAPVPGMPGYPFAQAHSGANVAMGLGITSVVCALGTFVCCVTIPGVLAGPFAIALGVRARKEMQERPGLYNNEAAATTGLVTGIIGTVLGLAMVAIVVFFFGFLWSVG
ncbi:DUF4190 domain-containing protein [Nocardioides sp.]|uniref:DUF4190 domain-containing protein n=1 Tax=Nocardioides sp. TaxID=35761 RepID=UPI0027247C52|nr:DUF4190 domain-containing protein [Nocardioides sp.]MDO9458286.1 DUF4190 domain-containing protein [Nocardioides sp.]